MVLSFLSGKNVLVISICHFHALSFNTAIGLNKKSYKCDIKAPANTRLRLKPEMVTRERRLFLQF